MTKEDCRRLKMEMGSQLINLKMNIAAVDDRGFSRQKQPAALTERRYNTYDSGGAGAF
jgi:hypothetical protein